MMEQAVIKENRIVPLVMCFPHERNYRSHPEAQVKQLVASLERFGQGRSIVVQECSNGSYTIVAGHGIAQAAEKLQWRELRADILPAFGLGSLQQRRFGRDLHGLLHVADLQLQIERDSESDTHLDIASNQLLESRMFSGDRIRADGQIREDVQSGIRGYGIEVKVGGLMRRDNLDAGHDGCIRIGGCAGHGPRTVLGVDHTRSGEKQPAYGKHTKSGKTRL